MNPTIWKMSGPFDPKIKAALPDCDRQSGDRSGIMLSRQFPTSISRNDCTPHMVWQSGWAMCFFII